jgi:hypothetical protein
MKKIFTILLVSCLISCNNKKKGELLTKTEAEKLVREFADYKNHNYDGAGITKIDKVLIKNITINNDTAFIEYEWNGEYNPPSLPRRESPGFLKAEKQDDNVTAIKTKKGWSTVPEKE